MCKSRDEKPAGSGNKTDRIGSRSSTGCVGQRKHRGPKAHVHLYRPIVNDSLRQPGSREVIDF